MAGPSSFQEIADVVVSLRNQLKSLFDDLLLLTFVLEKCLFNHTSHQSGQIELFEWAVKKCAKKKMLKIYLQIRKDPNSIKHSI
jgi:hypothetical protein